MQLQSSKPTLVAVHRGQAMTSGGPGTPCERRDVILTYSWADTWGDATRRGMSMPSDRLLCTLTDHPAVSRLLAANPYRSWPIRVVRQAVRREPGFAVGRTDAKLVEPLRLRRRHPSSIPQIQRLYARYDRRLQIAAERFGMTSPVVITCNPFLAAYAPFTWSAPVTFYAFDDWAAYPPHRPWWPAYEAAYAEIRKLGRRVCAVSQTIIDRLAPTGEWVVMPNGLAPEEWQEPWIVPPWFEALPRPRFLYIGTLDSRLDTTAVLEIASAYSSGSVVLIGQVTEQSAMEPLRYARNVHFQDEVGRKAIAGLVHEADVCLLPHRRTPLTSAMSPLKLYEYLASGRPVAASDLPPVRAVDDRVVIVPESASFADGVAQALELGAAPEDRRHEFLVQNSWARRHQAILDLALRP